MLLIVVLISGVCTVGFWRGVWYLWDVYFWPQEPVKSAWFTFGLGKLIIVSKVITSNKWKIHLGYLGIGFVVVTMNRVLRVCTDDRANDDFAIISSNVSKKLLKFIFAKRVIWIHFLQHVYILFVA